MATEILLRHSQTGIVKKGFYGFSWTSFFFGGIPAIIRGDFTSGLIITVVVVVFGILTAGLGALVVGLIWAFIYNKRYTQKLLESGYEFYDAPERVTLAKQALGIVDALPPVQQ